MNRFLSEVADRLLQIERVLREMGEWESEPPSLEALQSTKPFAIDTLAFTQWLQFIFIAKMKVLIESDQPLPAVSGMAPMAEEHFRGRPESGAALIRELEAMDQLLSSR